MTVNELFETLRQLETELHQADTRRDLSRLNALLHPDFQEFGRSGRSCSRDEVLSECSAGGEYPQVVSKNFKLDVLGEDIALLTYTSAHKGESGGLHRHALRSSLWVRGDAGWQMRFHQGTPTDSKSQGAS